ncbi:MAG: helix-turn-helix domain-containing protein [Acidobacteria bacterium]|nr:helix-turn-helix domain-containing protein [Acidobacteriota bacterium]
MDADELREKRKALEMTQAHLARALGVNIMTVSRWERGLRSIPPHLSLALEAIDAKQKKKVGKRARQK